MRDGGSETMPSDQTKIPLSGLGRYGILDRNAEVERGSHLVSTSLTSAPPT